MYILVGETTETKMGDIESFERCWYNRHTRGEGMAPIEPNRRLCVILVGSGRKCVRGDIDYESMQNAATGFVSGHRAAQALCARWTKRGKNAMRFVQTYRKLHGTYILILTCAYR